MELTLARIAHAIILKSDDNDAKQLSITILRSLSDGDASELVNVKSYLHDYLKKSSNDQPEVRSLCRAALFCIDIYLRGNGVNLSVLKDLMKSHPNLADEVTNSLKIRKMTKKCLTNMAIESVEVGLLSEAKTLMDLANLLEYLSLKDGNKSSGTSSKSGESSSSEGEHGDVSVGGESGGGTRERVITGGVGGIGGVGHVTEGDYGSGGGGSGGSGGEGGSETGGESGGSGGSSKVKLIPGGVGGI